jgi:UDP-MurNAc hydroxylase
VQLTFCGHVGFFVETRGGSVLCDPWFTPATSGRGSPSPQRHARRRASSRPTTVISHLHRDHFDPEWLARHVDKRAKVLLPQFRVPFLERELRSLGFEHFVRTVADDNLSGLWSASQVEDTGSPCSMYSPTRLARIRR